MLTAAVIVLLGLIGGVIVNYFSDVLPTRRKLVAPFCIYCQSPQPISNYFFWPRRCDECGKRRKNRTWIVELLYIITTLWLWINPPQNLGFEIGYMLLLYFGVVVVIDIEHHLILHPVSLVGGVIGFIIGVWLHGFIPTVIGGAAGFTLMLLLYILGYQFSKLIYRFNKKTITDDALGFGDVMLGGVLGLLLGWPGIILGLVLAILMAGLFSLLYIIIMLILGRYRSLTAIPYGPFMVAGTASLLFLRDFFVSSIG